MRCDTDLKTRAAHPGNRRAFIIVSEVRKSLETYATLLSSGRSPWSAGEMADSIRDDAKRLKELVDKFDFGMEVFE